MKRLKILLGVLLIIPLALIVVSIADPKAAVNNPTIEWIFILIGVPSFVFNLWAWTAPHIFKSIFNLRD